MSVLTKTSDNYDRFIVKRSQLDASHYFHMKEEIDDLQEKYDKMMVDSYDEANNNQIAYNALLQSEILTQKKQLENVPVSYSCFQKFSRDENCDRSKPSYFEINTEPIFTQ